MVLGPALALALQLELQVLQVRMKVLQVPLGVEVEVEDMEVGVAVLVELGLVTLLVLQAYSLLTVQHQAAKPWAARMCPQPWEVVEETQVALVSHLPQSHRDLTCFSHLNAQVKFWPP